MSMLSLVQAGSAGSAFFNGSSGSKEARRDWLLLAGSCLSRLTATGQYRSIRGWTCAHLIERNLIPLSACWR